jgi:HTH-type transcriptional regulator/antitoxin HigA
MKVEIEPIRTETDHEKALAEVERLWGAPQGTFDGDRLDVLIDLVEAYERKHHAIPPPDPVEAIKFAMDQRGMRPVDLGPILGSTPRVYEVLSGKRGLSLRMIRALHRELNIPLESLIGA